jgi:CubicO group peptidase (beta-lactamase class C family)
MGTSLCGEYTRPDQTVRHPIALFLVVCAACGGESPTAPPLAPQLPAGTSFEERIARLETQLDALRGQAIPALSAAVVRDGQVAWSRGFGFADVERGVPAAADTPYRVASITKTFTSMLLMRCVEQGTLDLDTPIRRYTATIPEAAATVRHVLTHTSAGTPGANYNYDGDRFVSLTPVVEACAGAPYRVALAEQILEPLAMADSVPGQDLEAPPPQLAALFPGAALERYQRVLLRIARPYQVVNNRATLSAYPPKGINASAGLVSTVLDLARYDAAIDDHRLLSAATQQLAWTPATSQGRTFPYALGWFVQETAGRRLIWHYGQWPTFSALMLKAPGQRLTLILLANSDGLSAPYPLTPGDVTTSPFARAFLELVVL